MHRSFITLVAGIVAISVATGAVAASAARTAAPPFELTVEGWGWDWYTDSPFVTDGEFTASGAFCPAGRIQMRSETQSVIEVLTCADGSGTATVRYVPSDHSVFYTGQPGWRIVGGTGRYERLRGQGTVTSVWTGEPDATQADCGFDFVGGVDPADCLPS